MTRKINIIEGPLSTVTKKNAQVYLINIAKRKVEEGKYPTKSIS